MPKSTKDKKVRCGVIGVGYWGKFHAQKYAAMEDARLHGISDLNGPRGEELAEQLSCSYYADYRALCAQVDLVSVAVPAFSHHQVGCDALQAGVHCLVEKPLAVSIDHANEMIDLAAQKRLVLRVGYIERYNPAFIKLKEICDAPRFINVERLVPYTKRSMDVNAILDLMIHDLDLVIHLMNSPIKDVRGIGLHVLSDKIDTANVYLSFENGGMANVSVNRTSLVQSRTLRVFQDDRYLAADMKEKTLTYITKNDQGQLITEQQKCGSNTYDALDVQLRDFVCAVREDDHGDGLPVNGKESMLSLDVAIQISKILAASK